jgi:hypothetical protein
MQPILTSHWFKQTAALTLAASLLTFVPYSPVAVTGGVLLLILLPGLQLSRWLGLHQEGSRLRAAIPGLALGLATAPILIYWSGLLFGFSRWLLLFLFPLYILALAALACRAHPDPAARLNLPPPGNHRIESITLSLHEVGSSPRS